MIEKPFNGLTMVDLFCGAGVGACGFKLAGYKIIFAVDNKKYAVDTYNQNIGNHAILADIRKLTKEDIPDADVITGGFPCQPFSCAGNGKGISDKNSGDLGYHFYRIIKEKQPRAFLMENVNGIINAKHRPFFLQLVKLFEDAGYNVTYPTILGDRTKPVALNCWEHGVPQLRKRIFLVGVRKDIGKIFKFPKPIPIEERTNLRYAIGDLPNPDTDDCSWIRNQDKYYEGGYSSRYLSRNRQKQWDEPSFTIVSVARQLPLYPEPANYDIRYMDKYNIPPPRRFTVRECLRIQTVPDWFYFSNDISLLHQYERCSGIPSLIAYKLGNSLAGLLNK